jgi:vitamin-K-epoxide reductase (warfarin-sensitive)
MFSSIGYFFSLCILYRKASSCQLNESTAIDLMRRIRRGQRQRQQHHHSSNLLHVRLMNESNIDFYFLIASFSIIIIIDRFICLLHFSSSSSSSANMFSLSTFRRSVNILCVLGIALSLYAFYVETKKITDPSYRAACDINERMSCSRVLTSRWGRGFGLFESNSLLNLPDSLYGLAYYCLSICLNQSLKSIAIARVRILLSILTNLGSMYLGYILYFVLHDMCIVCCGMYLVNFILLVCNWRLFPMTTSGKHKQKRQ